MNAAGVSVVVLLLSSCYGLPRLEQTRQADMTQMCINAKCMNSLNRIACIRKKCGEVAELNGKRETTGEDGGENEYDAVKSEVWASEVDKYNKQNDGGVHKDVAKWFGRWREEGMKGTEEGQPGGSAYDEDIKSVRPRKKGYNDVYRVCMTRHCLQAVSNLEVLKCAIKHWCA